MQGKKQEFRRSGDQEVWIVKRVEFDGRNAAVARRELDAQKDGTTVSLRLCVSALRRSANQRIRIC